MMSKPLVSIITVSYNSDQYIEQTIKSVLNQTYNNIEYIIIDGKSNDDTLDIIKKYETKFEDKLRWISEEDKGIFDAMNKGISLSEGQLIGIINSDDYYYEDTVEKVVNAYLENPKAGMFYGDLMMVSEKSNRDIFVRKGEMVKKTDFNFNHPTCFIKKNIYDQIGKYEIEFKLNADYDFMLKIIDHNIEHIYIDSVLAAFRLGGASSDFSFKVFIDRIFDNYKILKKHKFSIFNRAFKVSKGFYTLFRNGLLYLVFGDKFSDIREKYLKIKN